MWRIEFRKEHNGTVWFYDPGELHGEHGRFGIGEVVSYCNHFATKDEARRVARMIHSDITVRFVQE